MKNSCFFCMLLLFLAVAAPVSAGTKEELKRLENDIITLQNQFREFEKNFDESMVGLKSLVEQLNDQAAKSNMLLNRLTAALEQQSQENRPDNDAILPEIRSMSNRIDDMATSLSALARQISDLKVQSQPVNRGIPAELSADSTYKQAFLDFTQENFDSAIQGFNIYLSMFPSGTDAPDARYYLGTAYFYSKQYPKAVETFTGILQNETDSNQITRALYKRAQSYLAMQKQDSAVDDFRRIIEKYPQSPEAGASREDLEKLGVRPTAPNKAGSKKR